MSIILQSYKAVFFGVLAMIMFWPTLVVADVVIPEDRASAVVLAYHRIGEGAYPDTNLRIEQFQSHVEELASGGYNVLSLERVLSALKDGEVLPPKTIALTFEGGYKSAYQEGMKALVERGVPFTVFLSSDQADRNSEQYMNWEDVQTLHQSEIVSFGLMPASYDRFSLAPRGDVLAQINKARTRFRDQIQQEPKVFSYPFGEYSLPYKNLIEDQGFTAAFGLQSGALYAQGDMFALPRFSMTESYGSLERFKLVSSALPFPAYDITPDSFHIQIDRPAIGFSVSEKLSDQLDLLSCFVSGQGKANVEILSGNRVELRLSESLSQERTRVNCTIPVQGTGDEKNWRWLGMLLVNNG